MNSDSSPMIISSNKYPSAFYYPPMTHFMSREMPTVISDPINQDEHVIGSPYTPSPFHEPYLPSTNQRIPIPSPQSMFENIILPNFTFPQIGLRRHNALVVNYYPIQSGYIPFFVG